MPGAKGGWEEEVSVKMGTVSVWEGGKVLEMNGDDDYTTVCVYIMP